MSHCNSTLGKNIRDYLKLNGVETPILSENISNTERENNLVTKINDMLKTIGIDITSQYFSSTSKSMANLYVNDLFYGLKWENFPTVYLTDNALNVTESISHFVKSESVDHMTFLPVRYEVNISYIPSSNVATNKIINVGSLEKVIQYFTSRPQNIDLFNNQLYYSLLYILKTDSIAIHTNVVDLSNEPFNQIKKIKLSGAFDTNQILKNDFLNNLY